MNVAFTDRRLGWWIRVMVTAVWVGVGLGAYAEEAEVINRGRYLIKVSGCNDCHTPNWMASPESVDESDWLIGMPVGWYGPWGTTYASNLRLSVTDYDENAWVTMLKTRKAMPPMPWINVSFYTDEDARAIYLYIKSLGAKGERMPAPLPPGTLPKTPYFDFHIKGLPVPSAAP